MANTRILPINYFDDSSNITASSEVAGMEAVNAMLPARSKFWRTALAPSTDGSASVTLQGNWGGASRSLSAFGLFRHNCHGGTARLQLYSDSSWTTQVRDTTALTVEPAPLALGTGWTWGVDPLGTTLDDALRFEAGFVAYFTATTCQSWRLTLAGPAGLGKPWWQVGRFWLARYIELSAGPAPGMDIEPGQTGARARTLGGAMRGSAGGRWRRLSLDLRAVNEADRQTLIDLAALAAGRDIVLSVFPGDGGRVERDFIVNGALVNEGPLAHQHGAHIKRMVIEEL